MRLSLIVLYVVLLGGSYYVLPGTRLDRSTHRARSHSYSVGKQRSFDSDAWVKGRVDALPAYNRVLNSIARTIRERKLAQDQEFSSRYREFVDYIQAASLDQQPDHDLGFTVPDGQYFRETSQYVQIPEFLLDQDFLRWVSRYETLERAKSFLRRLNSQRSPGDRLIFFSYTSRHLGTPDNDDSYRRLLIVVPGDAGKGVPEKWVQFGVTDPRERVRVRNVSVVSVVPDSDGRFNTYFKDSYRTYHRDGSISIKGRWELGYGDDNCARCHKSGILPIFPVDGSVTPDEEQAVSAVNQRFRSYGTPRFGKYLDETRFGPGLSSATWPERNRRFGKGFSQTPVGLAMKCASCHRPEGLGSLNWPMDPVVISSYIKGGQMPIGEKLQPRERNELYENLIQEYFATGDANPGILKSWLLGRLR